MHCTTPVYDIKFSRSALLLVSVPCQQGPQAFGSIHASVRYVSTQYPLSPLVPRVARLTDGARPKRCRISGLPPRPGGLALRRAIDRQRPPGRANRPRCREELVCGHHCGTRYGVTMGFVYLPVVSIYCVTQNVKWFVEHLAVFRTAGVFRYSPADIFGGEPQWAHSYRHKVPFGLPVPQRAHLLRRFRQVHRVRALTVHHGI